MKPVLVRFDDVKPFQLADGVSGRHLFGDGAMVNVIEFEPGATVSLHRHPFRPVRDDYRERRERTPA